LSSEELAKILVKSKEKSEATEHSQNLVLRINDF